MGLLDHLLTDLLLYPVKLANQAADWLFYDVGNLDPSEWARLSPMADLKGTIIVVSPRASRRGGEVRQYGGARQFLEAEGDRVRAVAVAGGGSSVLGTASLARGVADATGWDVAGIVTGFGVADLAMECLGGYVYGRLERLRCEVELAIDRWLEPESSASAESRGAHGHSDVRALCDILLAGPPNLRLLVGHSRGSLLLGFVLNHMKDELGDRASRLREAGHPLFGRLTVVTLGAVVGLPEDDFALEAHQFLGQLDLIGRLSSDRFPPILGAIANRHESVPGAGHHLNPIIPCSLSVADTLRRVGLPRPEDGARRGGAASSGR